jgi:hypothetical protein
MIQRSPARCKVTGGASWFGRGKTVKAINLWVGKTRMQEDGKMDDYRSTTQIVAEEIARHSCYTGIDKTGGVKSTLYKTEGGRFMVYREEWSMWPGENCHHELGEVTAEDWT